MDWFSLPEVHHIGVVVKDVEKVVKYYTSNFSSVFQIRTISHIGTILRGKPVDFKVKVARARIGEVYLQLIQPLEGRTIELEFLKARGEGIHHVGFSVDDLESELTKWKRQGFNIIQRSKPGTYPRFAYLDTDRLGAVLMELVQSNHSTIGDES